MMYTEAITKVLGRHFVLYAGIGAVLAIIAVTAFFVLRTPEPVEEPASAIAHASSSIPYVTETKAFNEYLRNTLAQSNPESVQAHLRELYKNDSHGEQHMAFHYLGEVIYEQIGAQALPSCRDWYGFGCAHGLLLDAIGTEGYQIVPSLDEACKEASTYPMDIETCQHGIGHGLIEASGRDPFEAIEACDLVDDVYPKLGCASGVFMEYFSPIEDPNSRVRQKPVFDEDDPYNVCDDFRGLRQATCLFEIQSWWQDVALFSPAKVEEMCNAVEDQEAREFCLIGYGNMKAPRVDQALPYCDQFVVPESHALCRAGILWASEHFYEPQDFERACNNLGEYEALCFEKGRFTCEVEGSCVRED